jgi:flagellar motor switch protein FliM
MSEDKVLEQAEIDALIHGVDTGVVSTLATGQPGEVQAFDFSAQLQQLSGRMPTLGIVNDRFVRMLRTSVYNLVRRTPEISMKPLQLMKFSEYLQRVGTPSSLNLVKFNPLRGTGLIVLEPQLVFAVVENFFGGSGRQAQMEQREFTATEQRIIHMILRNVFADLREAWSPVTAIEVEYLQSESNPQLASIVAPNDAVVLMHSHIELEGGGGGLHIVVPYATLEPLREILEAGVGVEPQEKDERWSGRLREEIEDTEVELKTLLGHSSLTLADLLNLKPGDVLPCDFTGKVMLLADEVPLFRGSFGLSRGQQAVKVESSVRRPKPHPVPAAAGKI